MFRKLTSIKFIESSLNRNVKLFSLYVQGQSPEPKIREYFYYIDHEGMVILNEEMKCPQCKYYLQTIFERKKNDKLFLDDARIKNFTSCFKDKSFLVFFFKRLKRNDTNRYQHEFPYLSVCGRERNFIRCDDFPIVFREILSDENDSSQYKLTYANCGNLLTVPFQPDRIFMAPETGRVYHPASDIYGSIGLVRSKLSIELSQYFEFCNGEGRSPTHFTWNGHRYELDTKWISNIEWTPAIGRI